MKSQKNVINFYCLTCKRDFNQDVGTINFDTKDGTPKFENTIKCEKCGNEYSGEKNNFDDFFELTETGQSQLTYLFMNNM